MPALRKQNMLYVRKSFLIGDKNGNSRAKLPNCRKSFSLGNCLFWQQTTLASHSSLLQSLRTRQVCNRDAPVQTGPFPSSVETANERDRRSVSAVSVGGQCLRDLRDLRDLIAASSPPGHVTVALWTFDCFHSLATMIFPYPYLALTVWRNFCQYAYCMDIPLSFMGSSWAY